MKRSGVIEELLESYYFQHGKRVNSEIISKARKLIDNLVKEERKTQNAQNKNGAISSL